jgi:uncharacterized membrane protein
MKSSGRSDSLVPAALLALSLVPVVAGIHRLAELAGRADITPENARFFAAPLPVILHILTVIPYCILGAFQFAPGFRRRNRGWHRAAGKFLVPCGLVAALSGLWMTHFYPFAEGDGELLYVFRLFFGAGMVIALVLAVTAIRRRDFARHGAWMVRGYAIGQGAGTQVLTHLPWFLLIGKPGELSRALLMGAGWSINVVVAEWIIRKRMTHAAPATSGKRRGRKTSAVVS